MGSCTFFLSGGKDMTTTSGVLNSSWTHMQWRMVEVSVPGFFSWLDKQETTWVPSPFNKVRPTHGGHRHG